jgi:hypothetical protein
VTCGDLPVLQFRPLVKVQIKLEHRSLLDFAMPRELKSEPMQKLGSAPNVHLLIRRMYHKLKTAMVMSMAGGRLHQASSNRVIHRIAEGAKTVQMRRVVIMHVNGDRPNNPTQSLGDPKMILRPPEVFFLNFIDVGSAVAIHETARCRRRMQLHYLLLVGGLKASNKKSIERVAVLESF